MANPQVAEILKDLPVKILTNSSNKRRKLFDDLTSICSYDLPDPIVKGICKVLPLTLTRYDDSKSRSMVERFVKEFVELQPQAYKHLISVLSDVGKEYKNVVPTKGTGKICIAALEWSVIVNGEIFQKENRTIPEENKKLVEADAVFMSVIAGSETKALINKALQLLLSIWKDSKNAEQYAAVLSSLDQTYQTVILWGFFLKHLSDRKAKDIINKYRNFFVETFTKVVIGSKTKPPLLVLECSKPLLRQVPHEDFKQILLPSIQKAMLRNPEIILQCVGHIIANVPIDLSPYSLELGKALATHLHSKEDLCREEAVTACRSLAEQCSNPQSVEDLLNHFFGVLNGSEGKLTVVVQRLGVLSGAGYLSYHTVTGSESVQKLSEKAAEHFISVLKQEVHEGTLIHAINMLALWCSKFTTQVPNSLLDWFQTAFGLKTSTSAVRNAYIHCMEATFHGNVTLQALQLTPLLIKAVEKSLAQSSQHLLVSEGLSAACLLLRIYTVDVQAENKIKTIMNTLLEVEKLPFLSEKYLVAANEEALLVVMKLCERLITDHASTLVTKMKPLNKALFVVLTHPSVRLRKQAQVIMRKLLSLLGGSRLALSLLAEFPSFVQQTKIQLPDTEKEDKESKGGGGNDMGYVFPVSQHSLIEFLTLICSGVNMDQSEHQALGVASIIPAHLPAIVSAQSDVWVRMLLRLKQKPVEFVISNKEQFFESILHNSKITPAVENSIRTLVKLAPDEYLPKAVALICELLSSPNLHQVTLEEYEIFCTPEGELYDKSVIENLREDSNNVKNIKRESKLYSYKEQLEEIELRKELEQKKRAKGQGKQPELTKKQQEAMKAQLEKESLIRNQISEINEKFQMAVKLFFAVLKGNSSAMAPYVTDIIPALVSLLSSPLCAPTVCKMYLELRHSIFSKDLLIWGEALGYVTLRMLSPSCQLDPEWTAEDLSDAVARIVGILYSRTCRPVGHIYDEKAVKEAVQGRLTAPAFAYFFQLVSSILLRPSSDSNICSHCLYIMSEHCNMRAIDKDTDEEHYLDESVLLKDPCLLPRKHMFTVLAEFIQNSLGGLQDLACSTILELSRASSGMPGCAIASFEEIEVLLKSLHSSVEALREVALKCLFILKDILPHPRTNPEHGFILLQRIWVAKFDLYERAKNLADSIWDELNLQVEPHLSSLILSDVLSSEAIIQAAAAIALATVLQKYPDHIPKVLRQLILLYREKSKKPPEMKDMFGRVIPNQTPDNWEPRCGIAQALGKMAPLLPQDMVAELINFIVDEGFKDSNAVVQKHMLDAGIAVVDAHGNNSIGILLPVFEGFLDRAPDESSNDVARESVVILLGTLARHLEKDDPKVKPIVAKLIETLSTPSQQVQEAVANCLPPLVPAIKEEAPGLVRKLLHLLLESEKYGERKGAAYGLAGLVKGLGILSLKQMDIMTTLTNAIQNKKNFRHREGALFAFEMLCNMLGRLFEPYVVHVLPHLLLCFGDGNQYVREATDDTAKAVMQKLSAHGVKLVMPILLEALEEESWRTKAGSVELLGAMAFCAPKQLSSCLPSIVPKLIEVLSDSHMKVQKAGAQALKIIGSVIRNPEIQAIVPVLLDALQDPSKKTATCLATLLNTKFVHFIDAPSLALIMPVVQRAFQDRSTETRKMAAQIIGNMYSLTDQKDLAPYLPTIIPGLKQSLLDPVPEVRSVSARALGAMVRGMGESSFEDLLPWLMQTLTSEASSVDRSGAAQGLSEVMGGLGVEKLHKLMPDIIATAERPDIAPHVKDGYIMMFIYLPMVFNQDFTPYIGQIINPILKALADENEFVRDTALKAGQRIVNMYAETAIALLLPQLEKGLFDDNWRIRYSSVQLLGDLLYKISGVSGKMTTETADEDDNFGTEQSHKAILQALGVERRNQVLAGLYMGRSDVALMVRQAALHVWKVVVTNTPRTLREILQTLFQLLLGCLASNSYDKRQVAARTLGDLVRKLGERVLPEIIPILEKGLDSNRADQRQGVCIGLSEIMASTSKDMVLTFVDSLVPTVRRALYDPLPEVRQAAAKTFDSLHSTVGVRALEDILPQLLNQLNDPKLAEYTLDGLRQVMAIKSKVVLPYLVPQLTAVPVNTRALSFLSAVAGGALTKHLGKILPALLQALSTSLDTPKEQQELEYCQAVVLTVTDEVGVRTVIDHLLEATRSESVLHRRAAVALLYAFCCQTKADIRVYVPQLLRGLIHLFTDSDQAVLQLSWEALNSVTKTLGPAEQLQHVADVRQAVRFAVSDLKGQELMPGFCLQKGITPILPIFREAILNGQSELKEQASQGLGEVIKLTSAEALKPSVVHITGPLIRILGDRFTWNVKVAVLETLSLLLAKVGVVLKPFLPQLQTTFLKALNDGHRTVRLRAATALSHLIVIQARCDPLFQDVHNAVKNAEDSSIRETMLHALRCIITPAGDKMTDPIRRNITATITGMIGIPDDMCRTVAAGCLGALCRWLPEEELTAIALDHLLDDDQAQDWMLRHGQSVALMVALKEAPSCLLNPKWTDSIVKTLISYMTSDRLPIALSGIRGTGFFLKHMLQTNGQIPQTLLVTFAKSLNHSTNEVKQVVALTCSVLAKSTGQQLPPHVLKALVPLLVNGTKEKNTIVKANSEFALVSILRLRSGDEGMQNCLSLLDLGARDALQDVITKVLRKVASHAEPKEDELDDTLLT